MRWAWGVNQGPARVDWTSSAACGSDGRRPKPLDSKPINSIRTKLTKAGSATHALDRHTTPCNMAQGKAWASGLFVRAYTSLVDRFSKKKPGIVDIASRELVMSGVAPGSSGTIRPTTQRARANHALQDVDVKRTGRHAGPAEPLQLVHREPAVGRRGRRAMLGYRAELGCLASLLGVPMLSLGQLSTNSAPANLIPSIFVQSVKTLLKLYLEVLKIIPTVHP
jgi:hypothetical protein